MKELYKKTYSHLHASDETYLEVMNMYQKRRNKRSPLRALLIAAAITVLLVTTVYAAVNALIDMRTEETQINTHNGETKEGVEVHFDKTEDVYIELDAYYPQWVPEGYEIVFVTDTAVMGRQYIDYENDAGKMITYTVMVGGEASNVEIFDIETFEEVDINGQYGILYYQESGDRTLVWLDREAGYGFELWTNDENADILSMARGAAPGEELVPTMSESTEKALAELGDYRPEYLPEGYAEQDVLGCPLEEGGGWYSYVRRYYVNKEENTRIYFEYETYAIDTESGYTDDARTVCSFFIPGCNIDNGIVVGSEGEVCGMYALITGNHIAWADPGRHVVYHLYSEDVIDEALLAVAQSIKLFAE